MLDVAESEDEKQKTFSLSQQKRNNLTGNIDKVVETISSLIEKLSGIEDLPVRLSDNGWDTLDYNHYFTDFDLDKGDGYIGNNFGQDLRNFKRFLEFAKEQGARTAYFIYG